MYMTIVLNREDIGVYLWGIICQQTTMLPVLSGTLFIIVMHWQTGAGILATLTSFPSHN